MPEKIILCVDMQDRFWPDIEGGRPEGRSARPWEGDHGAWDGPNAFIERAAKAGTQTWYVAFSPDPKFKDTASVVGGPDWEAVNERFRRSEYGGFSRLLMTEGSPVFFKRRESVLQNPQFLAEVERQGVKEMTIIGCDAYVCCPANALDSRAHGLKVNIIQDHVFGGEMDRLPLPIEDKGKMRKAINAFRASDERTVQLAQLLEKKRDELGISPSAAAGIKIITEEAFFFASTASAERRPIEAADGQMEKVLQL